MLDWMDGWLNGIIMTSQTHLAGMSKDFKSVLEVRTKVPNSIIVN